MSAYKRRSGTWSGGVRASRALAVALQEGRGMALDEVAPRPRVRDPVIDLHARLGRRCDGESHRYPERPAAHGQCFTPGTTALAGRGFKGCGSSTATVSPSSTR